MNGRRKPRGRLIDLPGCVCELRVFCSTCTEWRRFRFDLRRRVDERAAAAATTPKATT